MRTLALVATLLAATMLHAQGPNGAAPLPELAPVVTAPHLTIALGTSTGPVSPGSKVSLWVDVTPDPGVHVYAPGTVGYKPIALTLKPSKTITAGKTRYPASHLAVLAGDAVQVFDEPFRLTREVTVAKSVKPRTSLVVSGTLDYQACDDKVCFVPASVPVSWTIGLGAGASQPQPPAPSLQPPTQNTRVTNG
jgi:DsbC/DsbD-like thiol-disulfide interchange protein